MKKKYRLKYMIGFLMEKKRNLLFSLFMMTVSFVLFLLVLMWLFTGEHDIKRYQNCFLNGTLDTYRIQINDMKESLDDSDNFLEVINQIEKIDGVLELGFFSKIQLRFLELKSKPEYAHRMQKHYSEEKKEFVDGTVADVLFIDNSIVSIIRNTIPENTILCGKENGNDVPILVGAAFRDIISIGEHFLYGEWKFTVVGYTTPGELWPEDGLVTGTYDQVQNMDYLFVIPIECGREIFGQFIGVNSIFLLIDKKSVQRVQSECIKLLLKAGITAGVSSVEEYMEPIFSARKLTLHKFRILLVFMIGITVFTVTCTSLIALMIRSRKIGIWYACGVLPSDLSDIIFMEQFVKVLISTLFAYRLGLWAADSDMFLYYYKTEGAIWLGVLAGSIFLISSIIPCIYMRHKQPMELLRSKE